MANGRRRITAPRRAPDGSAFQKCERCGVMVAVALSDMHDCGNKARMKREGNGGLGITKAGLKKRRCGEDRFRIEDQPRSPFCCFMEIFKETCKGGNWMEIDQEGFNMWKNMSKEKRERYVIAAEKVNSAYDKILKEEMDDMSEVDDEADSSLVGKIDLRYVKPTDYLYSSHWGQDSGCEFFDGSDWDSEAAILPNF